MTITDRLVSTLRTWQRMPAGRLLELLQVSRPTLMRAVRAAGPAVITRGSARRTAYAARRALRGDMNPLPLYRIDEHGDAAEVARLHLTYPDGCALDFLAPFEWPMDADMQDGWFDGLPYPLQDLRPQGFLGRQFARQHAPLLGVGDDPARWSDDDALHALSLLGADQSGNLILGEAAFRLWQSRQDSEPELIADDALEPAYAQLAQRAMTAGDAGSSAGGEFPKFTAVRLLDGEPAHVIVKFSGSDDSEITQRWSDLLVCEHLASTVIPEHLGLAAARSTLHRAGHRTCLEVVRFDRHGLLGRSALCSWSALSGAMFGLAGRPWTEAASQLLALGFVDPQTHDQIARLWHFGRLTANTDMHEGNLSFVPGLKLSPTYDVLPMLYAPVRGVELPEKNFAPPRPLPSEREAWQQAAQAATVLWQAAAADTRISAAFRRICEDNGAIVRRLATAQGASGPR